MIGPPFSQRLHRSPRARALEVILYSNRGNTSASTVQEIKPSASSSRSWVVKRRTKIVAKIHGRELTNVKRDVEVQCVATVARDPDVRIASSSLPFAAPP